MWKGVDALSLAVAESADMDETHMWARKAVKQLLKRLEKLIRQGVRL